MKWKDTKKDDGANADTGDPYYADDGYSSFKEKGLRKAAILSGNSVRYLYWGLGIAVVSGVVLLVMLLFYNLDESVGLTRIKNLEQKIQGLEQRLEKYEGMDEKVTRIWEQAKSFEKFKTRFDRSEASMSLRMDHLAMSLDALQKKTTETFEKVAEIEKQPSPPVPKTPAASPPPSKKAAASSLHTVVPGDTLFSISQRYKISLEQLRSINKLSDEAVINVGQKLRVRLPAE
ncbi:MAG: LysM peptidoglycan-binding domain-containing protein [Desulfosarcina sp.]|jgi:hypothetical protein